MIFVSADHHFWHANMILRHGRPSTATDEYMISRWNEAVSPGDEVWHLGDFAWGDLRKDGRLKELVGRLNGTIKLVKGNHDRNNWSVYHKAGIAKLFEPGDSAVKTVDGQQYILTHRGPKDYNEACLALKVLGAGAWWMHGHSHGKRGWFHPRVYDAGVDVWCYSPLPLSLFPTGLESLRCHAGRDGECFWEGCPQLRSKGWLKGFAWVTPISFASCMELRDWKRTCPLGVNDDDQDE